MKTSYVFVFLSWLVIESVVADVPQHLNYQGYLTNHSGGPVNGVLTISVSYWTDPVDVSQDSFLYAEDHISTQIEHGLFNIPLGAGAPVEPGDNFEPGIFNASVWIQITINGEDLLPRRPFVSTAYSFRAQTAETVMTNAVRSNEVLDESLTGNDIANGSITSSDVADGSLTFADLASDSRPKLYEDANSVIIEQSTPFTVNEIILSPQSPGFALVNSSATVTLSPAQRISCRLTQQEFAGFNNAATAQAPNGSGMTVPVSLTGRFLITGGVTSRIYQICQIISGPLSLPVNNARVTVLFVPGF